MFKKTLFLVAAIALSNSSAFPMLAQALKNKSATPPPVSTGRSSTRAEIKLPAFVAVKPTRTTSAPIDIHHKPQAKRPCIFSPGEDLCDMLAKSHIGSDDEDYLETKALISVMAKGKALHSEEKCPFCQIIGALGSVDALATNSKLFKAVFAHDLSVFPTMQNFLSTLFNTKHIVDKHQSIIYFALPGRQILRVHFAMNKIITIKTCALVKQNAYGVIEETPIYDEDDDNLVFTMNDLDIDDN